MALFKRYCSFCNAYFETKNPYQFKCDKNHCERCARIFIPIDKSQVFCSQKCKDIDNERKVRLEKMLYRNCEVCGKSFRKPTDKNSRTCENCNYAIKHPPKTYDNSKHLHKKRAVPIEELNRRAEYKRLMDEGWANRVIRNKKWE